MLLPLCDAWTCVLGRQSSQRQPGAEFSTALVITNGRQQAHAAQGDVQTGTHVAGVALTFQGHEANTVLLVPFFASDAAIFSTVVS